MGDVRRRKALDLLAEFVSVERRALASFQRWRRNMQREGLRRRATQQRSESEKREADIVAGEREREALLRAEEDRQAKQYEDIRSQAADQVRKQADSERLWREQAKDTAARHPASTRNGGNSPKIALK